MFLDNEILLNRSVLSLPTTTGVIVSNPITGYRKTKITSIVLCNSANASKTVNLYAVPNSSGSVGTAGATNILLASFVLEAYETFAYDEAGVILDETNDTLQGQCVETASVVSIKCYGEVI